MPASLSLTLNVKDIGRSLAAYRALGFKVKSEWKDDENKETYYAELALGDVEVGLAHIPSNDDKDFRKWVSTPLGAGVVIEVTVPDVDAIVPRAKKAGVVIEAGPTDRPYGRVLVLNDPDGYTLSFYGRVKKRSAKKRATKPRAKKSASKRAG